MIRKTFKKFLFLLFILCFAFNTISFCTNEIVAENEINLENQISEDYDNVNSVSTDKEMEIKSIDKYLCGSNITIDYWVDGNVFVVADTLTIKGQIGGDLFVVAKNLIIETTETESDSKTPKSMGAVYGNVFAAVKNFDLNGQVYDVYTSCADFKVGYYGFVYRDIHVNSNSIFIDGIIKKNAFINSNSIETTNNSVIGGNLDLTSSYAKLSGNFGNNSSANDETSIIKISSKVLDISNEYDEKGNLCCSIDGNLEYNSKNEISIEDGIVSGSISYSKLSDSKISLFATITSFIVSFISLLIYVLFFWFIIKKFAPKLNETFFNIISNTPLKALLIGFICIVALPLVGIILSLIVVGYKITFLLIIVLSILLILSLPVSIISISELLNNKILLNKKFNSVLWILIITLIFSILQQLSYVNFIINALLSIFGVGAMLLSIYANKQTKEN